MRIIDRYILASFGGMFLGSLISVCFLFTVISILDSLNHLLSMEGATLANVVRYFLLQLPQTVYMGAPVAALLSAMITLGGMNQHHELMAMRAAGISLMRVVAPMLGASLVIGLLLFVLGDTLVPLGNRHFLTAKQELQGEEPDPEQRSWYVSRDSAGEPLLLRIEEIDRRTGRLQGLTVFRTGKKMQLKEEVVAASAFHQEPGKWVLEDARVRTFAGFDTPHLSRVERMDLDLPDTAQDLQRVQRAPEEMTLAQLSDQIDRIKRHGLPSHAYLVERQARFAIPLAAFILVMVGAPMAIRPVRTGGLALSILGAIIIGFGYFVIIALLISLGRGGMVDPWAAAWMANVIFGGAGLVFFMGLKK